MRQRLQISWVWVTLIVWQMLAIALGELLARYGLIAGQLFDTVRQGVQSTGVARLTILKDVWLLIQQHPWMGVGWRQLQVNEVLTPGIADPVDHAHNVLAQIQVELGVLGTVSLLGFVAYWLFKKRPWQNANGAELAMVCVLMVLGLHSMLEYPLWQALFLFLFGFAFSLLPEDAYPVRLPLVLVKALALVMLLFTAWFSIDHHKALTAYERYSQNPSQAELVAAKKNVWWNRLLLESLLMVNTPITEDSRPFLRVIATENANVFSQTNFFNLPLLKVKIQDGETAVANQIARRICLNAPPELWPEIQTHLQSLQDPKYTAWLKQLPPDHRKCKE
jgi:hypothetical protein